MDFFLNHLVEIVLILISSVLIALQFSAGVTVGMTTEGLREREKEPFYFWTSILLQATAIVTLVCTLATQL